MSGNIRGAACHVTADADGRAQAPRSGNLMTLKSFSGLYLINVLTGMAC